MKKTHLSIFLFLIAVMGFYNTAFAASYEDAKASCTYLLQEVANKGWEVEYYDVDQLDANYHRDYWGTRQANVNYGATMIDPDQSAQVGLYLYDENNVEIASDTTSGNTAVITHTPKWTGKFTYRADRFSGSGYYCYAVVMQ